MSNALRAPEAVEQRDHFGKKHLTGDVTCVLFLFETSSARPPALNAIPSEPETPEKRTERQVRQCRRMAELGMKLAEAAARTAMRDQAKPSAEKSKDMGPTFARIAGTIHQAIKLEAKLTAPPQAPRTRRPAAPQPEPKRPMPPPPETYPEPPATEWPFLPQYAQPKPAEPPTAEPKAQPAATPPSPSPPPPAPAQPAWTPPPPHPRATDPPRPTGPNWARLFER